MGPTPQRLTPGLDWFQGGRSGLVPEFLTLKYSAVLPPTPSTPKTEEWAITSQTTGITQHVPSSILLTERVPLQTYNVYVGGGTATQGVGDGFLLIKYFETFLPP